MAPNRISLLYDNRRSSNLRRSAPSSSGSPVAGQLNRLCNCLPGN